MLRTVARTAAASSKACFDLFSQRLAVTGEAVHCLQRSAAVTYSSESKPTEGEEMKEAEPATDQQEPESSEGADNAEEADVPLLQEKLAESTARVAELEAELAAAKSRSMAVLADMDNLRKRTTNQMEEAKQFALQGFCKSILDVADNLERALDSVPGNVLEASKDGGAGIVAEGADAVEGAVDCPTVAKNLCSLHGGVAMSEKIMLKIFAENGLERVDSEVGSVFDPEVHNAMFEVPSADIEPGSIAAVVKRGYALNGRVIRAAGVGVAKSLD